MTTPNSTTADDSVNEIAAAIKTDWDNFISLTAELRPDLFSFGRQLTGSPFDGEDLVQEALIRAFGAAAFQDGGIRNLRSYLFRTMSNAWIDQQRRSRETLLRAADTLPDQPGDSSDYAALHTGVTRLLDTLRPLEQAAVLLHEAFGFPHGEIADLLSSSEAAVKMALHRGKARLQDQASEHAGPSRTDPAVVSRFIDAFRAGDIAALQDMLVDSVETVVFPAGVGRGAEQAAEEGWLRGCMYHHVPEREAAMEPFPNTIEAVDLAGHTVLAVSRDGEDGRKLEEIWWLETVDGQIVRVRDYGFCPDLVSWAGAELGMDVRRGPYAFPPLGV